MLLYIFTLVLLVGVKLGSASLQIVGVSWSLSGSHGKLIRNLGIRSDMDSSRHEPVSLTSRVAHIFRQSS